MSFGIGVGLAEVELSLLPAQALQTMADSRKAGQPRGLLASWVQRWDVPAHVEKLQNMVERHKEHAGGHPEFGHALVERREPEDEPLTACYSSRPWKCGTSCLWRCTGAAEAR